MLDKEEQLKTKNQKGGFTDKVKEVLAQQQKDENGENEQNENEFDKHDEEDDLIFGSPKNEFEQMLHRKIYELNQLQTDFRELQLIHQKEKSSRLKAEEEIIKLKRQFATDKKNIGMV